MMASQPPSSRMALVEKLVWAPAPFQSPRIGLGSSVANTPKSSAMRNSSHRATQSWSDMSRGESTPIWNSHWPIITSALVPSMAMPGVDAGRGVQLDDLAPGHLVAAHAAVVRALRRRVADVRPAERPAVLDEGVLLLDAEQRLLVGVLLDDGRAGGPGVGRVRGEVGELAPRT